MESKDRVDGVDGVEAPRRNPFAARGGKPLTGRTAIVTGSGQNIGRGIALMLAEAGANVVINGRQNRESVERVAAEARALGVEALPILADVSDPVAVERMVNEATARFGGIDIAISNTGIRPRQAFHEITIADWHRVIDTNLSSVFYLARLVLPGMQARRWGRLINISGVDGWKGLPNRAHNVACKAAEFGLAKALAIEYGPYGITSNTVASGIVDTTRVEKDYPDWRTMHVERAARIPVRRLGRPDDIGAACLYLCSDAGEYVTGQVLHVNGGEFMY